MDVARRKKMALRWTLFVTAIVAAYRLWRWYVLGALVPVTAWSDSLDSQPHELGFTISPLWDILVAAALTALIVLFATSPRMNENRASEETALQKVAWALFMIPASGIAIGPFFAIFNGLTVGVAIGTAFGFAVVVFFIAPILAFFVSVRWLVLSVPFRTFGRWLMASETANTDP